MKNQQLKDFMEARGLQQKQTAQMLDISIATLSPDESPNDFGKNH